jgi:hypothetical protein
MKIPRCTPQMCHGRDMHTDATVSGKRRSLLQRRCLTLCNTQQVTWSTLGGGSGGGDGRIMPRAYRQLVRTEDGAGKQDRYSGERCSPQVQQSRIRMNPGSPIGWPGMRPACAALFTCCRRPSDPASSTVPHFGTECGLEGTTGEARIARLRPSGLNLA